MRFLKLCALRLVWVLALTKETVTQTLERVSSEITKEESDKLLSEQKAHQKTRDELNSQITQISEIRSNIYWKNHKMASILAWTCSIGISDIASDLLDHRIGTAPNSNGPGLGHLSVVL